MSDWLKGTLNDVQWNTDLPVAESEWNDFVFAAISDFVDWMINE